VLNFHLHHSMVVHLDRLRPQASFHAQTPISSQPAQPTEGTNGGKTSHTDPITQVRVRRTVHQVQRTAFCKKKSCFRLSHTHMLICFMLICSSLLLKVKSEMISSCISFGLFQVLFISPTLNETSSLSATLQILFVLKYPPVSLTRYSFIGLSKHEQCERNKPA